MYQDRLDCYDQFKYFGTGTPLHEPAEEGKQGIVELLLAEGADPLIKDARGELAIEWAQRAGRSVVVKQLLPLSGPSGMKSCWDFARKVTRMRVGFLYFLAIRSAEYLNRKKHLKE